MTLAAVRTMSPPASSTASRTAAQRSARSVSTTRASPKAAFGQYSRRPHALSPCTQTDGHGFAHPTGAPGVIRNTRRRLRPCSARRDVFPMTKLTKHLSEHSCEFKLFRDRHSWPKGTPIARCSAGRASTACRPGERSLHERQAVASGFAMLSWRCRPSTSGQSIESQTDRRNRSLR